MYIKWNYLGCFLAVLCPYRWCQSTNNLPFDGFSWEVKGSIGNSNATVWPQEWLPEIMLLGHLTVGSITHISHGDNKAQKSVPWLFLATRALCSARCSPAARGSFPSRPHASGGKGPQSTGLAVLGLCQGIKLKRERINMSPRKREIEEGWGFRFVNFDGITSLCIKTLSNFGQDWWVKFAQIWTLEGLLNSQQFKNLKSWVGVALQAGQLSSGAGNIRAERRSVNAWESG